MTKPQLLLDGASEAPSQGGVQAAAVIAPARAFFSPVIGKYRCGVCGETGHYKQTCPQRKQNYLPSQLSSIESTRRRKSYLDNKNAVIDASKSWALLHPDRVCESRKRHWKKHSARVLQERKLRRDEAYLRNPKETWLLEIFRAARVRAKKAGFPFDNQVPKLALPDVCPVLGIPIIYHAQSGKHSPNSPSLDRVVPARGYTSSNVRVISNRANTLKNNASLNEMRLVLADMERIAGCGD